MNGSKFVLRPSMALLLLLLFSVLVAPTFGAEDAFRVIGADGAAQTWTVTRIKEVLAPEIKSVEFTSHGDKHVSKAVSLLALLNASGVPASLKMDPKADPHIKNHNLRLAILVMAKDGYCATFSLGELLPEIGNCQAWLELDEDGQPLPDRYGAGRLLVPTDQKPARWVHDISSITVVDPTAAATRPTTQEAGH